MTIGTALLTLCLAAAMAVATARLSRRRRRSVAGALDLDSTADVMPAGWKHLGARLNAPLSMGLRLPAPRAGHPRRLGDLIGLR